METTSVRDVQVPDWMRGERPRPEIPAVVGAAGGLLLLFGMFGLFELLDEDNMRVGGIALSLFGLLVGGALMLAEQSVSGALRSAGAAMAAGAVAPLAFLLVNDPAKIDGKGDFLVAGLLAVLLWGLLFALGPGRGHGLFLGLGLVGLWLTALVQTSPEALLSPFGALTMLQTDESRELRTGPDGDLELEAPGGGFDEEDFRRQQEEMRRQQEEFRRQFEEDMRRRQEELRTRPQPSFPEFPQYDESLGEAELIQFSGDDGDDKPVAPAVVSFVFGLVYLAGALLLDGMGLRRLGSAALVAAAVALLTGVSVVSPLHGAGAGGIAGLTVGVLLVGVGIAGERRFTAWLGAGVAALAAVALVGDAFDDPGAGAAVALVVLGAAVVAAGWLVGGGTDRPTTMPPMTPMPPDGRPPGDMPPPARRIVI